MGGPQEMVIRNKKPREKSLLVRRKRFSGIGGEGEGKEDEFSGQTLQEPRE